MAGPGARSSTSLPGHADLFQDGNHLRCVPPLAGRDDKPERAAPAFPGKVDLACEPASRVSQGLIGTVTLRAPAPTRDLGGAGGGAGRVLMSAAGRGIDADHAPVDPALGIGVGLDGTQDSLPRAVRRPPAMTVVDPSSNYRSREAGPARGGRSAAGTESRCLPDGGIASVHPARDSPASAAPAEPTLHPKDLPAPCPPERVSSRSVTRPIGQPLTASAIRQICSGCPA